MPEADIPNDGDESYKIDCPYPVVFVKASALDERNLSGATDQQVRDAILDVEDGGSP